MTDGDPDLQDTEPTSLDLTDAPAVGFYFGAGGTANDNK
jgi:hypothetical protein